MLKSMYVINYVIVIFVLRFLLMLDKEDIIKKVKEFGIFEIFI